MIFISWVIVIITALVIIQLPALPFRNMLKKSYQEILKAWESFPSPARFIIAIISFLVLACGIMFLYKFHGLFDIIFLSKEEQNLDKEALSNIRRNIWLLGFAIFGGCLAIWARFAHEKQLKYTREQLDNSTEINRNDRFAKAAEMLSNKSEISSRGGLYILRDLIEESPNNEYIRCVEIISYWLLEHKKDAPDALLTNVVAKILKIRNSYKELESIIERYKKENTLVNWPVLKSVNLQGTFLRYANLQGAFLQRAKMEEADLYEANLQYIILQNARLQHAKLQFANLNGAILKGANLTNAEMKNVKNLTKEQILSAVWTRLSESAKPPDLPDDLMKDSEVQEWLKNPAKVL